MAWVPYRAGDVLPMNAIVTGMLANGRHLYSSLSWYTGLGYWRVGSYAEGNTAAHFAHGTSHAVTEFDILVSVQIFVIYIYVIFTMVEIDME